MSSMDRPFGTTKKTSFLGRPAVVFLLFLLAALAVYSVLGMYGKYRRAAAARNLAETEQRELAAKHESLAESTERLSTERGQEEELRSRYRAVRPGEELIVIVDDGESASIESEKESWLARAWNTIQGLFLEEK